MFSLSLASDRGNSMSQPKFANTISWQQAELLMQPAFIRLIDNLRHALDQSSWRGTYEDVQIWPQGTSEAVKAQVLDLQERLKQASPEEAESIAQTLDQLPTPYPGYHLCLEQQDQKVRVDLWELCYQICFEQYSGSDTENPVVVIDTQLIDETGDVDWNQLDAKTKSIVERLFDSLPVLSSSPGTPS